MPEAFYLPAGENRYRPTEATTSPWGDESQHGGPPTALLATLMDRAVTEPGLRLARVVAELLGPVPRRELEVVARVARPGRRVVMTEATMSVGGRPVALGRAWHIATGTVAPPPASRAPTGAVEDLPAAASRDYVTGLGSWGYAEAVEWRFTAGGFSTPGPARVWTKVLLPLVAGEELTGYQRALVVADSANGISNVLPLGEWLYVPPSVTVHLLRHPAGEWVHLDATTTLGADGVGLTTAVLGDTGGMVGTVNQPLLVAPGGSA